MAAAIKALNAKIRSNPVTDYFWRLDSLLGTGERKKAPRKAPRLTADCMLQNFGIPLAAVMDTQKDPDFISGRMTAALCGYSGVFMRYSLAVTPKNYLLFGCHLVNFSAQSVQAYRFVNYWYMGGKEKALEQKAKEGLSAAENKAEGVAGQAQELANKAQDKASELAGQAKAQVEKVTR